MADGTVRGEPRQGDTRAGPFTSTATEVTALEDGHLDAAYLDPVAALQVWQTTPGGLLKIIAGAAAGGAELVVARQITSPALLKGRQLAAPTGGTQQAAADYWLRQHGLPALTGTQAAASTDACCGSSGQARSPAPGNRRRWTCR